MQVPICGYRQNPYLVRQPKKPESLDEMAAAEPLINAPEFTVSELSSALKRTVEDAYGHVRVRGEISGFRGPHSSGHCYFALKDESAKIEAVIWKGVHNRMRFKPQEGLEVIATGKLTTYPGSSKYQIVIEAIEPAGVGALMALMEERKRKLGAEGLFDEARKQLLPWLPEVIGVVTSPTGAVIRDILHRLQDRFPRRVLVWPVKVQGDGSAEQIAAAIRGFNATPPLNNRELFHRDRSICAFCGGQFNPLKLTCDHILPMSRGGGDAWMNVVTACRTCNQKKGNRTPEEAHMHLLYAPYIPNRAEFLILANRRILADQMEFLKQHVSANSRIRQHG